MDFSNRLTALRERAKLTQAQLAAACGHVQSWLGNIENGKGSPRVPDIYLLADEMGIHPGELFADMPSQSVGMDDATMSQALELLFLMADARPEDSRLQRPSWDMVKIAAKAISRAKGAPGKAMTEVLEALKTEA